MFYVRVVPGDDLDGGKLCPPEGPVILHVVLEIGGPVIEDDHLRAPETIELRMVKSTTRDLPPNGIM
jgi:hypothetical protein